MAPHRAFVTGLPINNNLTHARIRHAYSAPPRHCPAAGQPDLTGCTAKYADQQQFSGYLRDYSKLEKTESASGQPVLRWVDPDFKVQNYRNLVVQSIQFYPSPKPSEQVNTQALEELYRYTNSQVKSALGKKFNLIDLKNGANISGSQTLILRAAITGVSTSTESLKPYEIIPIALVTAAAMTAAGERDKNSELYLEAEFIDASTGKPVLQVVRKGFGKNLDNDKQQVTLDTLKGVIDGVVRDIEQIQ